MTPGMSNILIYEMFGCCNSCLFLMTVNTKPQLLTFDELNVGVLTRGEQQGTGTAPLPDILRGHTLACAQAACRNLRSTGKILDQWQPLQQQPPDYFFPCLSSQVLNRPINIHKSLYRENTPGPQGEGLKHFQG